MAQGRIRDACSEGKTEHRFRIKITCENCGGGRHTKYVTLSCDWEKKCAYTGDRETFQSRQVGCNTCRHSLLMHFHCTPGWDDEDYLTFADPQTGHGWNLMVEVENADP